MWWTLLVACDRHSGPSDDDGATTSEDTEDTGAEDDTGTPPEPPLCPAPAWARVVGGVGQDTIGVLGRTYDGALALLGDSEATDTFDVGDGPVDVGWQNESAWVAVLDEDDGALRWVTRIAYQPELIHDAPGAGFGLFAIAGSLDSGVVAAGLFRTTGVLGPVSLWEKPANAYDGFVVRTNLDGGIIATLLIEPDTAAGAGLSKLVLTTSPTNTLLLSGGGEGAVTFDDVTVDLGDGGMFVAELAYDLSVSWVWQVDNASPEASASTPTGWLVAGGHLDPYLPVTPLPYGPLFDPGFVVELDLGGLATRSTHLADRPAALWTDETGEAAQSVVYAETPPPEPAVDLQSVNFGVFPSPPATLLRPGPAVPFVDVASTGMAIGGLADVVEASIPYRADVRVELPFPMSTTTLFDAVQKPLCIVVTDALDVVNPELDEDGTLTLAGTAYDTFTVDLLGPDPWEGISRASTDGFVARLSSSESGYR